MEKTLRLSADQREDLVAYLDGELPDTKAQQIDQVLARSEVARYEVEALARTWELLDVLPTPKAPPEFTERTMTTLKVAEVPFDIREQPWFATLKRVSLVAVWVVAISASGWFGYQVTAAWIANPSQQLLQDLPILKKLDLYQEVESIDFLDKLEKSHLFEEAPGEAIADSKPLEMKTLRERYDHVVKMSQVERDSLQRNLKAFQQMKPEQQNLYRDLHGKLDENRKAGGQYSTLLQTYSAWLQTLTPSQREALRQETNSQQKLALVHKCKDEQYSRIETFAGSPPESEPPNTRMFGLPKPLSATELSNIMKVLLADLPTEEQSRLNKMPKPEQYVAILQRSIHHAPDGPRSWPAGTLQEGIISALPSHVRNGVKKTGNLRERLAAYLFISIYRLSDEARPRSPKEADLTQFLKSMDPKQRALLEQYSPDEMKGEVIRRYMEQHERHMHELWSRLGRLRGEIGLGPPPVPGRGPEGRPEGRGPDGRGPDGPGRDGPGRDGFRPGDRPGGDRPGAERPGDRPPPPPPRRDGKEGGRRPE